MNRGFIHNVTSHLVVMALSDEAINTLIDALQKEGINPDDKIASTATHVAIAAELKNRLDLPPDELVKYTRVTYHILKMLKVLPEDLDKAVTERLKAYRMLRATVQA